MLMTAIPGCLAGRPGLHRPHWALLDACLGGRPVRLPYRPTPPKACLWPGAPHGSAGALLCAPHWRHAEARLLPMESCSSGFHPAAARLPADSFMDRQGEVEDSPLFKITSDGALLDELLKTLRSVPSPTAGFLPSTLPLLIGLYSASQPPALSLLLTYLACALAARIACAAAACSVQRTAAYPVVRPPAANPGLLSCARAPILYAAPHTMPPPNKADISSSRICSASRIESLNRVTSPAAVQRWRGFAGAD